MYKRQFYIALVGFVVFILASCALENLRFYTLTVQLPLEHGAGGMLGIEIGNAAVRYLGYTGATLTLLAALGLGWSIFSGMSWLSAAERLGTLLETAYGAARDLIERWQDRRCLLYTSRCV